MGGVSKIGKTPDGEPMHYSVGAIIERDGKYLLLERAFFPPGWAGPAGHLDEGENLDTAIIREVEEETGLKVTKHELILEELVLGNACHSGIQNHYWYLYKCEAEGKLSLNNLDHKEAKGAGWFTVEELKELELEKVWEYWFTKLHIL